MNNFNHVIDNNDKSHKTINSDYGRRTQGRWRQGRGYVAAPVAQLVWGEQHGGVPLFTKTAAQFSQNFDRQFSPHFNFEKF